MNTALSAKRLSALFGALFVFQATLVVVGLSISSPKLFPSGVRGSNAAPSVSLGEALSFPFSENSTDIDLAQEPSIGDEVALAPVTTLLDNGASSEQSVPSPELAAEVSSTTESSHLGAQEVEVAPRDNLAAIFARLGAPHAGAIQADKALRSVPNSSGALRVGETISISRNDSGDVVGLVRQLVDGRIVSLSGSSVTGYTVSVEELSVSEEPRTVSGVIESSLSNAAKELELPFAVVDEFVDLFSNRVEFRRDLQPGDTFSVTYVARKNSKTGESLKPGSITSASLRTRGTLLAVVRHPDEKGTERYFDEQGNPVGNYFLRYPVQFSRISSAFSYARFHPVLKRARPHNGVDFAAPVGTPVRSVADGIVEVASYRGAAGNMVKITHCSRWSTAYLHLNSISSSLRPGMRVQRGQVIGTVGSTGLSTGPHLHFSLYDRGNYVDPMKTTLPSIQDGVKPLPQQYLLAALEALNLEHQRVAAVFAPSHAG